MGHCLRIHHAAIALPLALVLITRSASAQASGTVSGVVANAISGAPLAEVLITASGSRDSARTDAEGWYALEQVPPGLVKVRAQVIGYLPITTPYYSVRPDSTTHVDFKLAPLSVQLDTLRILGRRPQRSAATGAQVITREQLPARGNIVDALQGVATGVQVSGRREGRRVSARGSQFGMLFVVDGVVVKPPLTFYIDTQEVDCVEIRRGYRSTLEFRTSVREEPYSGVVLIWTRGSTGGRPPECRRDS